ncbi:MAG: uridine kinase [Actinobacteria bacterium]|nr:uridine kinase [Actinomycetota bacterium]
MDVLILGICGGSGSGKSTLAAALAEGVGDDDVGILAFDAYYRDLSHLSMAERAGTNFDHPRSLDVELFCDHLDALRLGQSVGVPVYDFASHRRTGRFVVCEPRPIVVAEGILLLSEPTIRARLDLCVFLDVPQEVRYERRLARDTVERGREPADVYRQFHTSVVPMHDEFVQPHGLTADVVHQHPWDVTALAGEVADAVKTVAPA